MIAFRHRDTLVHLQLGNAWSASSEQPSYHDTAADELRAIVADIDRGEPWRDCVARRYRESRPWLHRIVADPLRAAFFEQHPPSRGSTVLDIGAGWGQITLPLARTCDVVAVEPTRERLAFIQAAARQDSLAHRVAFVEADFLDLHFETKFDLVCCIGVLEWVPKFRAGEPRELQRSFLERIRSVLAPGGKAVIGIENRLGLKYLLGVPDDHIDLPGIGVLDMTLASQRYLVTSGRPLRSFTHSLSEYHELFAEAGFSSVLPFAAFPDYKLPQWIAPADASLSASLRARPYIPEHNGANGAPLSSELHETLASHYRSFAELGVVHAFAPSYFFVASA